MDLARNAADRMHRILDALRSGRLVGTRRLDLSACGLSELPAEVYELADTLEILDLSGNDLASLPDDLPRLGRLRILFASNNRFTAMPEVLGRCAQLDMVGFKANRIRQVSAAALPARLRWLILTDNEIEALPAELGRCHRLQKVALAGNRLRALPPEMADCKQLELLRISANRLAALPAWLATLPRLSWLAFAGNPFCAAFEQRALDTASMHTIDWQQLTLGDRLGEGASGVIHRADWKAEQGTSEVAVKVFKGAMTSDGLPDSEMAAALRAGGHPNLIPVLGRVHGHPAQAQALVMPLVPASFRTLAGPPSLDSCTRDVYPPDFRIGPEPLTRWAGGIAAAVAQLHRRGITHGDLYGHNILHDGHAQAYLGDFGAASFFDPAEPAGMALQRIEVRAFGCLLEELIGHCEAAPPGLPMLRDRCLGPDPAQRPLFDEIVQALGAAQS